MTRVQKRFTDTLADVRNGDVIVDLTEGMRELVQRVMDTGRAGAITLTLKLRKASKGAGATLIITDDIKVKLPIHEKGESVLFATADGDLQRNDPRQPRLAELDGRTDRVAPFVPADQKETAAQS